MLLSAFILISTPFHHNGSWILNNRMEFRVSWIVLINIFIWYKGMKLLVRTRLEKYHYLQGEDFDHLVFCIYIRHILKY